MARNRVLTGIVVDEEALTIDELAQACAVERRWVRARVEAGLLGTTTSGQVPSEPNRPPVLPAAPCFMVGPAAEGPAPPPGGSNSG